MKTLLAAIAALALIVSLTSCSAPQPENDAQQSTKQVVATAAPTPTPTPTTEVTEPVAEPTPEPSTALTISDVRAMGWTGTLDPPDYTNVFELRDAEEGWLADTAAGPRVLLTHAMSFGNPPAPGNAWQELAVGDRIEALGSTWTITERAEAPKSFPTDDPALMERIVGAGPGTLVLITCVPGWTKATHNLILIAEEAS